MFVFKCFVVQKLFQDSSEINVGLLLGTTYTAIFIFPGNIVIKHG